MQPRPLKTVLISVLLFSFVHFGYAQTGTIRFGISSPIAGHVVDTSVYVQANLATSTYAISTVVASVKGRSLLLTSAGSGVYYGNLSLTGLPAGVTDTLTIIFTDINNNSDTASEPIIYDPAPQVTISKPYQHAVARPTVNLKAACAANSGHCQLTVTMRVPIGVNPSITVGTFTDSVNTTIDLSAYQGMGLIYITVAGVDSFNASSSDVRAVYVDASPYLTPVYSTDNDIQDFNNNRAVSYSTTSGPEIGNITDGTVTSVPYNGAVGGVFFSNQGAVFQGKPVGGTLYNLYNWNSGSGNIDSIAPGLGLGSFIVNGNYCVFTSNNYFSFRNLSTQATQQLFQVISGVAVWSDLTASGAGAYYHNVNSQDSILLYKNGTSTLIKSLAMGDNLLNPATDGNNVVYLDQSSTNGGPVSTYRYDAKTSNLSLLATFPSSSLAPQGPLYTLNNGYTAYLNPDANGRYQAWIRDTAGNLIQASPFSQSSIMERLSSNGQLSFKNSSVNQNGLRYIYDPRSAALVPVSSAFGKPYWQDLDSSWYVAMGSELFRVNTNLTADKADSFSVTAKEDSLYTFSANDFASHYHTSGSLLTVTFSKLPAHGSLTLNGVNVALNQVIPRSGLSTLVYKPLINFAGNDTAVWVGSNGFTASPAGALLVINVDSVLPTAPPAPKIGALRAAYCSNDGQPVLFNVTNMPAAYTNTTVVATLDGQPLTISPSGYMTLQPWTIAAGAHTVAVIFSNSLGADTTSAVFTIVQASTPKVTLAANPSTLTTSTQQVVLTATDVSGGGTAPLYTFSTDYSFNSNIIQAESSNNTMTIDVASLTVGRNVIYVRMVTSDTCATAAASTDSVVLVRVQDTAVMPPAPKISGLMGDYCHNSAAQQVNITNMPASGSGVTVSSTLDGQPVTVSSAGAITIQPQTLSIGTHSLAVVFTDAAGADTTTSNFLIDTVLTPVVKLTFSPDPLTTSTRDFLLTATPVAAGNIAPQYTFAKTSNFSLPTIVGGPTNTTVITVNSLVDGPNVFYVRMITFDSCVSTNTAIDSVVVIKPVDSTGGRQGGKVTVGPNPFAGTITITNLDPNKSYGITLTNLFGQVLITQVVEDQTQAVLLTATVPRGIYFLKVTDLGNGKVVRAAILLSSNR